VVQLSKHLSAHWDETAALELYRVHLEAIAVAPPPPPPRVGVATVADVALALAETTRFLTAHGTRAELWEAVTHAVRRVEELHRDDRHAALVPMLRQAAALAERDDCPR
jgi:hypothetical protein